MARSYSIVAPTFWTGETGLQLAAQGNDARLLALYLITCQRASMIGLYHLPLVIASEELRWPLVTLRKALRKVSESGFAFYHEGFQHVWVPTLASWQIGESLQPTDKRVKGAHNLLKMLDYSPFLGEFSRRYREILHLDSIEGASPMLLKGLFEAPSEGASEASRTVEQKNSRTVEQKNMEGLGVSLPDLIVPDSLRTPEALTAIADWLEYKRSRGEAYKKPDHFQRKLAEFERAGAAVFVAAVNHSMGNNWQGLFPEKGGSHGQASSGSGQAGPRRSQRYGE